MRVVAHPVTALLLSVGGFAALYLTPLYAGSARQPALHQLVHLHFLLAGYLFVWVVAGPDPAPRRPSVPARLVVLGVAVAGHAVLSQLLYAGAYVRVDVPLEQRLGGATLMYYGGDIAELLVAVALVLTWKRGRSGQRLRAVRRAPHDRLPVGPEHLVEPELPTRVDGALLAGGPGVVDQPGATVLLDHRRVSGSRRAAGRAQDRVLRRLAARTGGRVTDRVPLRVGLLVVGVGRVEQEQPLRPAPEERPLDDRALPRRRSA